MTPDSSSFVLDASVAAKWYLRDEEHEDGAHQMLTSLIDGSIALIAPQHIDYEVSNVLRTAVRRGRTNDAWARSALVTFLSLPIEKVAGEWMVLQGFDLSDLYGCAAYDGLYVALAAASGYPLVHADRRLRNTLNDRFEHELWIEDFETPAHN